MQHPRHIAAMSLVIAMIIMATVIPHHHHNEMICPMIEQCAIDGNVNDAHTMHHDEGNGEGANECTFTATPPHHIAVAPVPTTVPLTALAAEQTEIPKNTDKPTRITAQINHKPHLNHGFNTTTLRAPPSTL